MDQGFLECPDKLFQRYPVSQRWEHSTHRKNGLAFLITLPVIGPRKPDGSLIASPDRLGRIYEMTCSRDNLFLLFCKRHHHMYQSRMHFGAIPEIKGIVNMDAIAYKHCGIRKTRLNICQILHSSTRTSHKNPFISMSGMEQRFAKEAEQCPLPKIVKRNKSVQSFLFYLSTTIPAKTPAPITPPSEASRKKTDFPPR